MVGNSRESYEIYVTGHLSAGWHVCFEGMSIVCRADGTSEISGELDQSALYGTLIRIQDLGLELISVHRVDAPLVDEPSIRVQDGLETESIE